MFEILEHLPYTGRPLHRESYMCAHVLLKLLTELRTSNKMQGLPSILSYFRYKFINSIIQVSQMLDSIYHMTLRLL